MKYKLTDILLKFDVNKLNNLIYNRCYEYKAFDNMVNRVSYIELNLFPLNNDADASFLLQYNVCSMKITKFFIIEDHTDTVFERSEVEKYFSLTFMDAFICELIGANFAKLSAFKRFEQGLDAFKTTLDELTKKEKYLF